MHTPSRPGMVAAYMVPRGAGTARRGAPGPHKGPAAHTRHVPVSACHMGAGSPCS
ncbi:hypothetical protein ACIBI8_34450 [Streptomyces sp. NPDC050529]|uniref:hypothetical protein n=1 Tax=Streptomyces sp. NPDC050529 TaxID=3365624 RepID=UPI0037AC3638